MNNKFKRALSSILAFIMLCSCVCVMNVSSVFAADTLSATAPTEYDSTYTTITQTGNSLKYSYDFGAFATAAVAEGLNSSANYNFTMSDGTVTGGSSLSALDGKYFYGLSTEANNLQVVKGSSAAEVKFANASTAMVFTVADNCTASMVITVGSSGGAATVTDSSGAAVTATDGAYSLSSGTYKFVRNSKLFLKTLEITVTEDNATKTDGVITLMENGAENGTTAVTVGGETLVSGNTYTADSDVVITATPNDGYKATVTVNGSEVNLTNNSYSFNVNGNADIVVTYEENVEICKYNISETGVVALEDGKITFDAGYALATPYVTTVYLSDGTTETPFTQGALPGGSSQGINVTLNAGDKIGVYYTTSDSGYTTKDQSKSGYATVTNSAGSQVAADSNTDNKKGNYAYYFEYQATTSDTFKIKSGSNRFVVYGIDYTPVTSAEYDLTSSLYSSADYSSAITSEDGKLVVNASSFNGTQHGVVFGTGNSFTLAVDGDSTILIGGCQYSNGSVTVTDTAGNTVASGVSTKTDGCYHNTKDTVKVTYKGEATTLTFAFTNTTYIPYISVTGFVVPTVTVGITLKDAEGTALAGVPVNFKKGAAVLTQTTDESGLVQFADILPDTYQVYTAQYTLSADTVEVTSTAYNFELTATVKSFDELPATASADDGKLYVGFVDSDSDYTGTIYYSIQSAHDAASADADIVLGSGTYYEQLKITKNTTITGATTNAADTVITYDDKSSTSKNGFHGDTIAILAAIDSFNASNITIQNSTLESAKENATAMSVYVNSASVALNFDNCVFDSFCDTIYTGKTNNSNTWVINNSTICGYQDTVCGAGDVTLNNCTWDIYTSSNAVARLFVPTGNSIDGFVSDMVANNLTVTNSLGSGKGYAFFGRGWGQGSAALVGKANVIINGYTDSGNAIVADGAATNGYTSLQGFDTKLVGTDTGEKLTSMVWLARANQTDNYKTTYSDFNSANVFQSAVAETIDGVEAYRIIGKINSALVSDANVNKVGFAVYNTNGTLFGNMADNVVYTDNDTDYYTVNFATDVDTTIAATVKPYVKYGDYDIEGSKSETLAYTAN